MPVEAITAVGDDFAPTGPEWTIEAPGLTPADASGGAGDAAGGPGFGDLLADRLGGLQELQTEAAAQSQALAAGTAADPSQVVLAVERAQLSMQLAAQLRDKGLEAYQEIFRTQV